MVVQVAPVPYHVNETLCSLNFAKRVRTVELGQASARTTVVTAANGYDNLVEVNTNFWLFYFIVKVFLF